jgi:fatty-acyl-CoA synthase
MHRHRGVMHTAMTVAHWHDVRQDECILAVVPLFHVTGMQNSMNMPIYAGATIVLLPRWDRDAAAELIERYGVSGLTAVPAMVVDLVANPNIGRYNLSSLRVIGGGGAAMPEAVARKLQELCGLTYVEGYGLTETMAPSHINPDERPKRQCLGIPVFDTDSRIIDPVTLKELPQGESGEIVTHGPQVLDAYWNQPAENEACFITLDGKRFFRTGDLGRVDEEGYFFFVDRLKRMINAAGFKVWPAEVEALLYAHPAVQEAVVIAKKDARSGERAKALIVLKAAARGQVSAEQIIEWAREHMAAYKVPREIEFVESLPRSGTGKVNWRLLQEQEAARSQ